MALSSVEGVGYQDARSYHMRSKGTLGSLAAGDPALSITSSLSISVLQTLTFSADIRLLCSYTPPVSPLLVDVSRLVQHFRFLPFSISSSLALRPTILYFHSFLYALAIAIHTIQSPRPLHYGISLLTGIRRRRGHTSYSQMDRNRSKEQATTWCSKAPRAQR